MLTLILAEKRLKGALRGVLSGVVLLWGRRKGEALLFGRFRDPAAPPFA